MSCCDPSRTLLPGPPQRLKLAVSRLSAFALALAKADAGGLLVHRRDRLVLLALLRAYAPALANSGRRRDPGGDRVLRLPARDRATAALDRRAHLGQHHTLDRAGARRPLRRDGAARRARARDQGLLQAVSRTGVINGAGYCRPAPYAALPPRRRPKTSTHAPAFSDGLMYLAVRLPHEANAIISNLHAAFGLQRLDHVAHCPACGPHGLVAGG